MKIKLAEIFEGEMSEIMARYIGELVTGSERSVKEAYFAYRREMKGKLKGASDEVHRRHGTILKALAAINGDVGESVVESFREKLNRRLRVDAEKRLSIPKRLETGKLDYIATNTWRFAGSHGRDIDYTSPDMILREGVWNPETKKYTDRIVARKNGACYDILDNKGEKIISEPFHYIAPTGRKPTEFYGSTGITIHRFDIDTRELWKLFNGNDGLGFVRISGDGV